MEHVMVLKRPAAKIPIKSLAHRSKKVFNLGGLKMFSTHNKIKLSLSRPSTYPLPKALLIGFWDK